MSNNEIEARIEQGQTATHQDEGLADFAVSTARQQAEALADFAVSDAGTLQSHLLAYLTLRQQAVELANSLKEAEQAEKTAADGLIKAMTDQGLDSFKAQGFLISKGKRVFPSVLVENRPKQMAWLREIGCGHLIQETVNAQTFAAFIRKDIMEAGREVPDFVKVFEEPTISLRRAR